MIYPFISTVFSLNTCPKIGVYYNHAALDLAQLKGLERVFVDEIEALKNQHFMKPERKQELAWKQVTKVEAYEKMKLLLPALTYAVDEGWEAPRQRGFSLN